MGSSHGVHAHHPPGLLRAPLLRAAAARAYELWRELEAQRRASSCCTSPARSTPARPTAGSSRARCSPACEHDLPHEVLTGAELSRALPRLPAAARDAGRAPARGRLPAPRALHRRLRRRPPRRSGAEVHGRERVLGWEPLGDGVRVTTDRGVYEADQLVVTAGAWIGELLPTAWSGLAVPERQVLAWLQPTRPELFAAERFPVFNLLVEEGRYYGFPVFGVPGFKFGRYHHLEETVDPDDDRPRAERRATRRCCASSPSATSPTAPARRWRCRPACSPTRPTSTSSSTCTRTTRRSSFASPCSGHGFKFCSVIGEIMADLAETRRDPPRHRACSGWRGLPGERSFWKGDLRLIEQP